MNLNIKTSAFTKVSEINIPKIFFNRLSTGIKEFDALFGEGILPGCSMTFCGQAGVGKTTMLLQMMEALAANYEVGYASGEESNFQLAFTCRRLGVKSVAIANETDVDNLVAATKELDVLVIDSFQALTSTKQMNTREFERYAVNEIVTAGKENECVIIFVMHLTKTGELKGSTLVPHAVDINFKITRDIEGDETARIINVYKNRFGSTGEYHANMTRAGIEISEKVAVVAPKSKANRRRELFDGILAMDPPMITKQGIMKKFNLTASQAYLALKELQDAGELVKYGRGDNTVYKKVDLNKVVATA
jgi:predicted ATP-dependent serine protease